MTTCTESPGGICVQFEDGGPVWPLGEFVSFDPRTSFEDAQWTATDIGYYFVALTPNSDDSSIAWRIGVIANEGDRIGVRVTSNTVALYCQIGTGAWALQDTVMNVGYIGTGYTSSLSSAQTGAVDNFDTGTIIESGGWSCGD